MHKETSNEIGRIDKYAFSRDLLDGIVASEVVHHVTLGAEALATVLGAVERPVIVVYAHVDRQIVSVVE